MSKAIASNQSRNALLHDSSGDPIGNTNPVPVDVIGSPDVDVLTLPPIDISDGDDVAQGAKADPPATTATTDPWTIISLLKGLLKGLLDVWNATTHVIAVQFTNTSIQANAGTNLNTSLLALESGGNLAELVMNLSPAPVINTGQATVGTTAGGTKIADANANRLKITIKIASATPVAVFYGETGLTTSTGDRVPPVDGYPWVTTFKGAIYGIVASGSQLVTYKEEASA